MKQARDNRQPTQNYQPPQQEQNDQIQDQYQDDEFDYLQHSGEKKQKFNNPVNDDIKKEQNGARVQQKGTIQMGRQAPSKQNNWNQPAKYQTNQKPDQFLKNPSHTRHQQPQVLSKSNLYQQAQQQVKQSELENSQQLQEERQHQQVGLLNSRQSQGIINQKIMEQAVIPMRRQQLLNIVDENERQIEQLVKRVCSCRNQIKEIGSVVDKDLQQSILRISDHQSKKINIKQLFSATSGQKNQSQLIRKLREQLLSVRKQCKSRKDEILIINQRLNDPIQKDNYSKYLQVEAQYRLLALEVTNKLKEKQLVANQVKRMKSVTNVEDMQHSLVIVQRNQDTLNKTLTQIKYQRLKLYQLQKEDIRMMEKLKFLHQLNANTSINDDPPYASTTTNKKLPLSQQHLKPQITQLLEQINSILEHRNQIQSQKSRSIRSLTTEVTHIEQENLQLLSQLRSLDALLLQFYSAKQQRKQNSMPRQAKTADKLLEDKGDLQQHTTFMEHINMVNQQQQRTNDKNIITSSTSSNNKFRSKVHHKKQPKPNHNQSTQSFANTHQIQYEETDIKDFIDSNSPNNKEENKRTNNKEINKANNSLQQKQTSQLQYKKCCHVFGDMKVDQRGAILSDEILGKVKLKQITLLVDNANCYGMQCKYWGQGHKEILGMKICEKNADQITQLKKLSIDRQSSQYISKINVGYSNKNQIKLIEFITSNQQVLRWQAETETVGKVDSVTLKNYVSLSIKAKLITTQDPTSTSKSLNQLINAKPKLKLAGLAFNLIQIPHK